jgi:hypothetical protein
MAANTSASVAARYSPRLPRDLCPVICCTTCKGTPRPTAAWARDRRKLWVLTPWSPSRAQVAPQQGAAAGVVQSLPQGLDTGQGGRIQPQAGTGRQWMR